MPEASLDARLAKIVSGYWNDPLGYVLFAWDWQNDTSIQMVELPEKYKKLYPGAVYGPDLWACEVLERLRDEVIKNNFNGRDAVPSINLAVASVSNTENQALMYAQLASLQRQNIQTVDSTVQSVATSGFRNTGSGANAINEASRRAAESYDQNLRTVQLSAYQNYMQAANDYFSSNIQIEGYRASSRNAQENYSLQRDMLESQYAYDREVTRGEIGYWEGIRDNSNYGFWDGVADFFSGW